MDAPGKSFRTTNSKVGAAAGFSLFQLYPIAKALVEANCYRAVT